MKRRAARWAAVVLVLAMAACSDDGAGSGGSEAATTESTAPTPTFTGDGTAFCNAMLAVGQVAGAGDATPAEVVEANRELVAQLDEAQVNTPPDAPPDFEALIDDYRLAAQAIFDANGDVEAAFQALGTEHPAVVARLGSSTSHEEAYAFLVERCGIRAP